MVDVHGGGVRSYVTVVVAVKTAMVLATSPYGDDQTREREVEDATVVASHGRAQSSVALYGLGGNGDAKCGFTSARMGALVGRGGRTAHGGAMGEVDCVVVLCGWRASAAEAHGSNGGLLRSASSKRARQGEAERVSARGERAGTRLPLLSAPT